MSEFNITASTNNDYFGNQEKALAEIPCQNCGKLVTVMIPFIGCIFCSDCMIGDSGWNDGTEDFYEKRRNR